jgi:hypothetical protein
VLRGERRKGEVDAVRLDGAAGLREVSGGRGTGGSCYMQGGGLAIVASEEKLQGSAISMRNWERGRK